MVATMRDSCCVVSSNKCLNICDELFISFLIQIVAILVTAALGKPAAPNGTQGQLCKCLNFNTQGSTDGTPCHPTRHRRVYEPGQSFSGQSHC